MANTFKIKDVLNAYRKTGGNPTVIADLEQSNPEDLMTLSAESGDPVMDELTSSMEGQVLPQTALGPFASLPSAEAVLPQPQTQVTPIKKLLATKKAAPVTAKQKKLVKTTKKPAVVEEKKEEVVAETAPEREPQAVEASPAQPEEEKIDFQFPYSLVERLQDAQNRQRDMDFLANAASAAAQVTSEVAGKKYEESPVLQNLRKAAADQPKQVQQLFEAEFADPKSAASKGFKEFIKQLDPTLPEITGDISAKQLAEFYPTAFKRYQLGIEQNINRDRLLQQDRLGRERLNISKESLEQRRNALSAQIAMFNEAEGNRNRRFTEGLNQRKTQFDATESDRTIKRQENLQNQFNKDKIAVDALKGIAAAEAAKGLLDSNTPVSDEAAKGQLARLSGEVGVLTDQDIARFGGSKALKARAVQAIEQAKSGRLSTENRKYLYEVINVLANIRKEQLNKRKEFVAKQGAKRLSMDVNEARELLDPGGDDDLNDLGADPLE